MKTILCIDAERPDLLSLADHVEHAGFRVFAADCTRQAMRIFASNRVDGVLLRQRSCSDLEAHTMRQHLHHVAPEVPVLLFDGPADVTASVLNWMDNYMAGELPTTNA